MMKAETSSQSFYYTKKYTAKQCSDRTKAEECKRKIKGSGYTFSDSVRLSDAAHFVRK